MDKEQRKYYPEHYRITFRAFRPIDLAHVNIKGTIIAESSINEHQNRPRYATYTYKHPFLLTKNKQDWDLEKAVYEYDSGLPNVYCPVYRMQLVYTEISPTETYVDFYYDTDDKLPKSLSNDVFSYQNIYFSDLPVLSAREDADIPDNQLPEYVFFRQTSSIFRYKIEYDEQTGWDNKITFFNSNTHSVNDSNGIYGIIQTHDEKGRVIQERYLYDESSFHGFENINTKKIEYDEDDNLTKIGFYYIKNTSIDPPLVNKARINYEEREASDEKEDSPFSGFSQLATFEEKNETAITNNQFMTTKEVLTVNESRNYAEVRIEWKKTEEGLVQTISFYDTEDNPCIDNYTKASKLENIYDSEGIKIKNILTTLQETIIRETLQVNADGLAEKVLETKGDTSSIIYYSYINGLSLPCYKIWDENNNEIEKLSLDINKEVGSCIITKTIELSGEESVTEKQVYDSYGRYIKNSFVDNSEAIDNIISANIIYRGDNRSICYYKNGEYYMFQNGGYARADFSYTNDGMISYLHSKILTENW